jgi:hypothetical protein
MAIRDERRAKIRARLRALADDAERGTEALLDDLDAIDAAHAVPAGVIGPCEDLTEEQAAELRENWRSLAAGPPGPAIPPLATAVTGPVKPVTVRAAPRRRTAK